ALQPKQEPSLTQLYNVISTLENAGSMELYLESLQFELLSTEDASAKFDLTLSLAEGEQGLFGTLEYNTDLFERSTIRRMAEHFNILLEGLSRNPQARILDLPLLAPSEQQLLVE